MQSQHPHLSLSHLLGLLNLPATTDVLFTDDVNVATPVTTNAQLIITKNVSFTREYPKDAVSNVHQLEELFAQILIIYLTSHGTTYIYEFHQTRLHLILRHRQTFPDKGTPTGSVLKGAFLGTR